MAAKKARKSSKPAAKKAAPRPVKGPREGSAAPDFDLPTDGTGRISLKALRGSLVVVYFYPRDDTPGCTKEACGFNDALPDFSKLKAEIVGVSKDKEASHARFRGKYGLKFQLAADTELKAAKAYGVWIEKSSTAANTWAWTAPPSSSTRTGSSAASGAASKSPAMSTRCWRRPNPSNKTGAL